MWLDILLPAIVVITALGLMVWRWKDSGEAFDSGKFFPALMATLVAAGAAAGTTYGDNMIVTPSGLVGAIIGAIGTGVGVVYGTKVGVDTARKVKARLKANGGSDE